MSRTFSESGRPGHFSRWAPVVAWMALLFYVSSRSDAAPPAGVSDTAAHLAGYTAFGALVVRAVTGGVPMRVTVRQGLWAIVLVTAYGVSDEIHQRFVPGRSSEIVDVMADAAGGCLAVIGCWAWGIITVRSDV